MERLYRYLHANWGMPELFVASSSSKEWDISGGLTAFKLIEGGAKPEDIVVLEAREAASGARCTLAYALKPLKASILQIRNARHIPMEV
jgi:hypothetical protein